MWGIKEVLLGDYDPYDIMFLLICPYKIIFFWLFRKLYVKFQFIVQIR